MTQQTVYLKLAQITEVHESNVRIKDIAEVFCRDKKAEAHVKALSVTKFSGKNKNADGIYIGSVVELVKAVEEMIPAVNIVNLGQADFIVKFKPKQRPNIVAEWMKTGFISLISFCGAAFAIMTFNNDSNVTDVFANIYYLTMGVESDGFTVLEFSYSVGITIGILVFFNHFAKWKLTADPTPIEVEMRLYEDNLNKTIIQNHGRKEQGIDVS